MKPFNMLYTLIFLLVVAACKTENTTQTNTTYEVAVDSITSHKGNMNPPSAISPSHEDTIADQVVIVIDEEDVKKTRLPEHGPEKKTNIVQAPDTDSGLVTQPDIVPSEAEVEEEENEGTPVEEVLMVEAEAKPDHDLFNQLLKKYVKNGKVNYSGIIKDKAQLETYLDQLRKSAPGKSWSRDEQLAYWINAYNAFTIKLIVDNYPVNSIMDISNGKPWDVNWIKIGGKAYSLNDIENSIIRPQFKEPRIHFAVNCAAISCPPLASEAFTAVNLDALLEKQTRAFISNNKFNTIASSEVEISKIFEWYAGDFSNLISFLNKYSDQEINASAKVKFKEYDWTLNKM
jgi:hypothetical protein